MEPLSDLESLFGMIAHTLAFSLFASSLSTILVCRVMAFWKQIAPVNSQIVFSSVQTKLFGPDAWVGRPEDAESFKYVCLLAPLWHLRFGSTSHSDGGGGENWGRTLRRTPTSTSNNLILHLFPALLVLPPAASFLIDSRIDKQSLRLLCNWRWAPRSSW